MQSCVRNIDINTISMYMYPLHQIEIKFLDLKYILRPTKRFKIYYLRMCISMHIDIFWYKYMNLNV